MFFRLREDTISSYDTSKFKPIDYIPIQELYRLVVDGRFHAHEKGWIGYEDREPGCLKAFFEALAFINQNDGRPISIEYIRTIHYFVDRFETKNRFTPSGDFKSLSIFQGGGPSMFGLPAAHATESGILEFINEMEKTQDGNQSIIFHIGKGIGKGSPQTVNLSLKMLDEVKNKYQCKDNSELAKKVYSILKDVGGDFYTQYSESEKYQLAQSYIDRYHSDIKKAKNDKEKLKAIVKLVTRLERVHPFSDRNLRTFILLLQMRAMMQNGMKIAVYENPNMLDLCSDDEGVELTQKGQKLVDQIENGESIFDFDTSSLSDNDKERFNDIVKIFTDMLSGDKKHEFDSKFLEFKENTLTRKLICKLEGLMGEVEIIIRSKYNEDFSRIMLASENPDEKDVLAKQLSIFIRLAQLTNSEDLDESKKEIDTIYSKAKDSLPEKWSLPDQFKIDVSFVEILRLISEYAAEKMKIQKEIIAEKDEYKASRDKSTLKGTPQ